jgi:hypothetical protein
MDVDIHMRARYVHVTTAWRENDQGNAKSKKPVAVGPNYKYTYGNQKMKSKDAKLCEVIGSKAPRLSAISRGLFGSILHNPRMLLDLSEWETFLRVIAE